MSSSISKTFCPSGSWKIMSLPGLLCWTWPRAPIQLLITSNNCLHNQQRCIRCTSQLHNPKVSFASLLKVRSSWCLSSTIRETSPHEYNCIQVPVWQKSSCKANQWLMIGKQMFTFFIPNYLRRHRWSLTSRRLSFTNRRSRASAFILWLRLLIMQKWRSIIQNHQC